MRYMLPLHVPVEVMEAGQEWPTSICLTQTSNVPSTGISLPLQLEGVDDHLLEFTLVILCSTQSLVAHTLQCVAEFLPTREELEQDLDQHWTLE